MPKGDWAWTQNRQIFIPDQRVSEPNPDHIYVPLRGYAYGMAVFDLSDKCIGWINVETLGYNTVREWMDAVYWADGGY
jgi:hypothetical protein